MQVFSTAFPEVKVVVPVRHRDPRGFFSERYNKREFATAGLVLDFVQDNHILSGPVGTVRALHYQLPPFAQDKLLGVLRGAVLDVAVDLRSGSPTFGKHVSVVVSAAEGNQVLVPAGFAHGFCTLEPETEVIYKVTAYYSPAHDRGILWNDPDLGIDWPVSETDAVLSERDRRHPRLRDTPDRF